MYQGDRAKSPLFHIQQRLAGAYDLLLVLVCRSRVFLGEEIEIRLAYRLRFGQAKHVSQRLA